MAYKETFVRKKKMVLELDHFISSTDRSAIHIHIRNQISIGLLISFLLFHDVICAQFQVELQLIWANNQPSKQVGQQAALHNLKQSSKLCQSHLGPECKSRIDTKPHQTRLPSCAIFSSSLFPTFFQLKKIIFFLAFFNFFSSAKMA